MGIRIRQKGSYKKTERFLHYILKQDYLNILDDYGKRGVMALQEYTPKDTGKTANSWYYEIEKGNGRVSIWFKNSNVVNYVNIAIILQYGHATRNGGWVEGRDYINPALKPIFDDIAEKAWEEIVEH